MDSCCHRRFFSFPITRDGFKPPRGTNKLKDGSLLLKYGRMVDDATRQAYVQVALKSIRDLSLDFGVGYLGVVGYLG